MNVHIFIQSGLLCLFQRKNSCSLCHLKGIFAQFPQQGFAYLANLCLFLGNIVGSGVMVWNSLLIPLSWERNKNQVGKSGRVLTKQKLDFVSLNPWRCFVHIQIHILIVCRLCTGLFSLIYPKQVNIFLSILKHVFFFLRPEHFIPSIWFFLSNVLVPSLEDLNFIVSISIVCAHLLIYTSFFILVHNFAECRVKETVLDLPLYCIFRVYFLAIETTICISLYCFLLSMFFSLLFNSIFFCFFWCTCACA